MTSFIDKAKKLVSNDSTDGKISNRYKFFLAFPGMPIALSNTLIHNAYIKFYTDMVGLDVKYVGILYLVFGIWNAINDPALGVLIDRFKYRPKSGQVCLLDAGDCASNGDFGILHDFCPADVGAVAHFCLHARSCCSSMTLRRRLS